MEVQLLGEDSERPFPDNPMVGFQREGKPKALAV